MIFNRPSLYLGVNVERFVITDGPPFSNTES
jgi:hypothetical protein